jgi:geranylgeranyl diphosphate synthase type II
MESENKEISLETLQYMHDYKTGKLLKLPIECGCLIGGATGGQYAALVQYAELIGLAFQIKDDILDVEGDFATLGKSVGSDAHTAKSTYPRIVGMEQSKKMLHETVEQAKDILITKFGEQKAKMLCELANFIEEREK